MRKTVSFLNRFWDDQSGAAAAEYVIILSIIGSALAISMILLSGAIAAGIEGHAACIDARENCN